MMKKNSLSISIISALLFLAITLIPAYGKTNLPDGVIGYAWVSNPDQVMSDADTFIQGIDMPPMASMLLRMGLGGLLENPNLSGVDMAAPLCLVSFSVDNLDSLAINFTLSSPQSYLRTIKKSLKVKSEDPASGITTYTKEVEEFDNDAYNEATEEEQADTSKFYKTVETTVSIAIKDKNAWISLDPDILKKIHTLRAADLKPQLSNGLVIVLQMQPLLDYAEPLAREGLETMELPEGDNSSPLGQDVTKNLFKSYLDFYLYYARQVRTVALGFSIDGNGVELAKLVEPAPDSPLEEFLAAQKKGNLSLARYLQPNPWLVIDGRLDKPEMLIELYSKGFDLFSGVLEEIAAENKMEKKIDLTKLKETFIKNIQTYLKCSGDEMAVSISSSPDTIFSAAMVQKITDPDLYRSYITKSYLESINELMPLYEKFGVSFDLAGIKSPEKYKGTEIFSLGMKFDFDKLIKKEMSEDEKKNLALFEAPMTIQMAATDKLAITEMAWGEKPDIKARLDLIAAGKSSFNIKELGSYRKDSSGVVLFSINRYIKDMISGMMKKMVPEKLEDPQARILEKLGNMNLPLLGCFIVENGNLQVVTKISMERILAVKALIEEMNKPPAEPAVPAGQK
ncbi:MAG: hypothetical protein U9N73_13425 [Candidatus Auribacterota bacterium]|nr:hypothetical protein [Candidatus Auribacterota bacterium]